MKRILFICIAVLCAVNIRAQVKINVDSFNEAIEQFNQTKDNNKKKWGKNLLDLNKKSPTITYKFEFPIEPEGTKLDIEKVKTAIAAFIEAKPYQRQIAVDWTDNQITLVDAFGEVASRKGYGGKTFDMYVQAAARIDITAEANKFTLAMTIDRYYYSNTFKSIEDCYWTYINRTAPFVSVNKQEDAIYTDAYISTCSRCFNEVSEFITLLMLAYDETPEEEG
ncbi:hypothetical protein [Xylanibacter ruminicola]|uniref:DUF4468 domain-containing protein n=1 Tax=Xylanibacter ruminicola TaxID=839 RepID=A0A1M6SW23_XYLRU|nr:hypothetical protein [Xylanibacter ruminicola]SHK48886.1 hypothetical protein SAMN05216463_10473 [Xylanibacter ruminicola]